MQFGYAQSIQVGDLAPIPYATLSSALSAGVLTSVGGICTDDFTIKGDFEIDVPIEFHLNLISMQNIGTTDRMILSASMKTYRNTISGGCIEDSSLNPAYWLSDDCSNINITFKIDGGSWHFINYTDLRSIIVECENGGIGIASNSRFLNSSIETGNAMTGLSFISLDEADVSNSYIDLDKGLLFIDDSSFEDCNGDCIRVGKTAPAYNQSIFINNSTFETTASGASVHAISLHNAANTIEIENTQFDDMKSALNGLPANSVFAPPTNDLLFDNNTINDYKDWGVFSESTYFKISNNTITGDGVWAISLNDSGDASELSHLENNTINVQGDGIGAIQSHNFRASWNSVNSDDLYDLLLGFNVYDVSVINNTFDGSVDDNALIDGTVNLNMKCNRIENGTNGANFFGSTPNLNYEQNTMDDNSGVGLYYQLNMITNPQLDKRNVWGVNGVDAQNDDLSSVSSEKYRVRPIAGENPNIVVPASLWFDPTGTVVPTACFVIGDGGGFGEFQGGNPEAVQGADFWNQFIDCELLEGEGQCMWNEMVLAREIDKNPSLLNDPSIEDFYNRYNTSSLSSFPISQEITESLHLPEELRDLYDPELMNNGVQEAYNEYSEIHDAHEDDFNNFRIHLQNRMTEWKNDISSISTENELQEDYQLSLVAKLDLMLGIDLSQETEERIVFLANQCAGDYGPAVWIARDIAESQDWNYTEKYLCDGGSSRNAVDGGFPAVVNIFPSPALNSLFIESNEDFGNISIFNTNGQLMLQYNQTNAKAIKLDISELPAGMYLIRSTDFEESYRFIKQ